MNRFLGVLAVIYILVSGCTVRSSEVTSPNGHIRLAFALDGNNRMTYQVSVGDTVFIAPSLLGFTAKDGVNLAEGFKVINTDFTTHDETWTQPWGENKTIRNHYNEMAVHLSDTTNAKLTLRFRIFEDGLGFLYEYEV
ncbi:glycoside hydrolase family 97 protein, partial [Bacteroides cellulosilyticus]|uniref:glycoside hydrolase family 97 N-terminal domain-containing protein n=1 Tax=Bacteroides cellulosilyticus TaxID=246787 RepID=UPI0012D1ACE0